MFQNSSRIKTKISVLINRKKIHMLSDSTNKYEDLPTLKSYPILGHSYLFLPGGKYKAEKLTEAVSDISQSLGPIFKLNLGGTNIVISVHADDARTLYRNEGKFPHRPTFEALYYYRKKNFNSVGIVPGNGEEWYKFRNGVTPLLKPSVYKAYEDKHKAISKEFVRYLKERQNEDGVVEDLFHHLLKFAIECISTVSPGYKFKCLQKCNTGTEQLIQSSVDFMDGLYGTLLGPPLWKIYKNTPYKKLESSHTYIYKAIITHLQNFMKMYDSNPQDFQSLQPFLHTLFSNNSLKWTDKEMLSLELFLAGMDATATTLAMTLHYLAHNKDVQQRARESLKSDNERMFLKACLKETLRLSPTAGANSRLLAQDAVFSGYQVPKGTLVSIFSSVTSRDKKYFVNPLQYHPERWLRTSKDFLHPFASLPFGHGPRMCPGKRLAFQEMEILLQEILREFQLIPMGEANIGMVFRMNRVPEKSINIKFLDTNF